MPETTPSFAAELQDEHALLLGQLSHVEKASHGAAPGGAPTLADHLRDLKSSLLRHFFFEEQGGYMSQILNQAPHLQHPVHELLAEHHRLGLELDAIIESAAAIPPASPPSPTLQQQVRQWIKQVRRHESRENQLVQGSCNQELGTDD